MAKEKVYKVSGEISKNAHIDEKKYKEMYARSINDSDVFWEEQAEEFITWFSKWDIIQEWNFSDITISWFKNAKLNVSYNCIDRHLEKEEIRLQLFGKVIILMIKSILLTVNYTKKFVSFPTF